MFGFVERHTHMLPNEFLINLFIIKELRFLLRRIFLGWRIIFLVELGSLLRVFLIAIDLHRPSR